MSIFFLVPFSSGDSHCLIYVMILTALCKKCVCAMIAIVCPKANMARPDEADQVPIRKYRVLVSEVGLFTQSLFSSRMK